MNLIVGAGNLTSVLRGDMADLAVLERPINCVRLHESKLMGRLAAQSHGVPALDPVTLVARDCKLKRRCG